MINAIYSSKLYRASKRKDKIAAAFDASASSELVMQLTSYLDKDYQDLATPEPDTASSKDEPEDAAEPADVDTESEDELDEPNYSIPKSLHADLGDDFNPVDNLYTIDDEDESVPESNDAAPSSESEPAPAKEEPVEESTKIVASVNILDEIDVIKGSLNGQEDTCGVTRIQMKENEVWIYYKDDINLNNIMINVIEFFNASGRTYLEFNRLARSDNAIVFVINNVAENIKPMISVEASEKVDPVSNAHPVDMKKKDTTSRTSQKSDVVRAIGLIKSLISDEDTCTNPVTDVTEKDDTHVTVTFKKDSVDYDITDVNYLDEIRKHRGEVSK